ncbi:MAG: hypothetical protein IKN17_13060 [Ruminococcus sp.]|nr:hypothetical protein [Ruminococcus sp.]
MSDNTIGFCDTAVSEDALGMDSRYKGIADFISRCNTPMTLAIQGDWGTGKTTSMKLISSRLEDICRNKGVQLCLIEFNTWQFSVVKDDGRLVFDLIDVILRSLEKLASSDAEKKKVGICRKVARGIGTVAKWGYEFGKEVVLDTTPGKVVVGARNTFGKEQQANAPAQAAPADVYSLTESVLKMRQAMQDAISSIVSSGKVGDRIYVFIDDLDRLEPRIAVELMEGLKNFMDCKDCVFILAVDQDVVERGLRTKYGKDFDREKASKFFDKIIQVPFALPVNSYNIDTYVKGFLDVSEPCEEYVRLLIQFDIHNPRTIKRSFNLLLLNECIAASKGRGGRLDPKTRLKLYSLLLLQLERPSEYKLLLNKIIESREDDNAHSALLSSLAELFIQNSDSDEIPMQGSCLEKVLNLFFGDTAVMDSAPNTEAAGELSALALSTMETAPAAVEDSIPKLRVKVMRDILHTLRAGRKLDLSGWEILDTDRAASNEGGIQLEATKDGVKAVKLTWSGGRSPFNLTLYTDRDTDEVVEGLKSNFRPKGTGVHGDFRPVCYPHEGYIVLAMMSRYTPGSFVDTLLSRCDMI